MKKECIILLLPCLLIAGCGSKKLDKKTALETIQKEAAYLRTLDYDIYCSDPAHARKLMDAGLEKQGFVAIRQKQKLIDVGKPLISFTEKAKAYLLPTSEKERSIQIQKVKLADEDVTEIISIEVENGNTAMVEFKTAYKNASPFAALGNMDFSIPKKHTISLSLHDNLWHIQKKAAENSIKKNILPR